MKEVYISAEDIYYGLSSLTGGFDTNSPEYYFRTIALADIIENIILSEKILFEHVGNSAENELASIIERNHLNEFLVVDQSIELEFKEHAPSLNLDPPRFIEKNKIEDSFSQEDLKILENLQNDWKVSVSSMSNKYSSSFLTQKLFELVDYLEFVSIRLEILTETDEQKNLYQGIFDEFKERKENFELSTGVSILNLLAFLFTAITDSTIQSSIHRAIPNIPSPLKASFMINTPIFAPSSKIFMSKINDVKYEKMKKINDFVYNKYMKVMNIPILFNYVVSKATTIKEVFEITKELKDSKDLVWFRNRCFTLDNLLINGEQEDALKIISELELSVKKLGELHSPKEKDKKITVQLSFPPAVSFDINFSSTKKKYFGFLKKIYSESMSPIIAEEKIKKIIKNAPNIV